MAPAGQALHAALLHSVLKKPTSHGSHVSPSYPGKHTQSSEFTVPLSSVVLLAPQAQQPWASAQPLPPVEALPTDSLKVPAGQAWQVCWLTATSCNSRRMMPVFPPPLLVSLESRKPALQRQELAAVPVAGCEFAGQAMQVLGELAAMVSEYEPVPQLVQA